MVKGIESEVEIPGGEEPPEAPTLRETVEAAFEEHATPGPAETTEDRKSVV